MIACDLGNLGTSRYSTYEWYEFKIRYTDVWGTLTPSANQTAGFAIAAYDFNTGNVRTWGGEAVDEKVPNTWGHVFFFVPEFPTLFLAVVPFVLVSLLRRRVRRPT